MTPCLNLDNYMLMKNIRDFAISYCTFFEATRGSGGLGAYADELINKSFACFKKLEENQNYVNKYCHIKEKSKDEYLEIAKNILNKTYIESRTSNVIERLYVNY